VTRRTGKKSARPAAVDPGVWAKLNDPGLGQVEGALAKTGEHEECVNGFGVFDMVGNLHEWVATDPSTVHGTFAGGYYLDTSLNGDGCNYRTVAHAHDYHDYSTGFRCCAAAAAP
jgi:formylglycine-generating enzyme required for sulfatase activity